MPPPQAVRRRTTVTRAPRSRARLISATNSRRFVAKPRTPHLHCAARAALQDQGWQCNLSLGGSRGIFSFEKENIPLDSCSATGAAIPTALCAESKKRGPRFWRGIIGTKSEPGINPCDGADSFGCPPRFFYAAGPGAALAAAGASSVNMAAPSSNPTSCAVSSSTGVSIRPMSR